MSGSRAGCDHAAFELATQVVLTKVPTTNFAAEQVLERADLQRALRANISVLDPDLLVASEEFGDFAEVRRRIDLLCVAVGHSASNRVRAQAALSLV